MRSALSPVLVRSRCCLGRKTLEAAGRNFFAHASADEFPEKIDVFLVSPIDQPGLIG